MRKISIANLLNCPRKDGLHLIAFNAAINFLHFIACNIIVYRTHHFSKIFLMNVVKLYFIKEKILFYCSFKATF